MSAEIHASYPSGATLYACVRNQAGNVLRISSLLFEAWGTGARTAADYDIALTGDLGDHYVGTFPVIAAGRYGVQLFLQAGVAAADSDDVIGDGELDWSGTAENTPAVVGSQMNLKDDAIAAGKFDESTAFPVVLTDSGNTKIARTGADSDTLETISDELDAIKAETDKIHHRGGPWR